MGGLVAGVAGGAALVSGTGVAAADDWCGDDPMVRIITPAGKNMVVRVTDYALGIQHLPALKLASYSYSVAPANNGTATAVTLNVLIPGDALDPAFPTRTVVTSAADENSQVYQLYSDKTGTAGTPIVHQFTLSIA